LEKIDLTAVIVHLYLLPVRGSGDPAVSKKAMQAADI
jgi:hypothetical protein